MRILIVEDEPRIRDFLTRAFRAEGFTATAVADGNSGVRYAISGEHDLVVLDLLLPGLNGLEVMTEIRYHQPDLPVLILSCEVRPGDEAARASSSVPWTTSPSRSPWTSCSHGRASTCAGLAASTDRS